MLRFKEFVPGKALKERAANLAREEGASIRVTSALNDESTRAQLRAAFQRGDFATWGYDDAYAVRAADPTAILAGARSIICIAIPYAASADENPNVPLQGRISNYAWPGEDYHKRVRGVLSKIARALDECAGAPVTALVCDTTPFAERAFAARAGLGWIGKHTNLISPELGSFVFLGEIITTIELPIDVPLKKTCGSCTRCVTACPTGALRGDYTIDATRCISDLTQRKDGIPREMRPLIGAWIWGCDICQFVCPPTQRALAVAGSQTRTSRRSLDSASGGRSARDDMHGISGDAQPSLLALVRMRSGEFKRSYRKTAMGWRGAAVLRRNAAVALGNSGDRSSVPTLVQALNEDPHPMVRGHIAWALGRIGSPQAFAALRERHTIETDTSVREEITSALSGG